MGQGNLLTVMGVVILDNRDGFTNTQVSVYIYRIAHFKHRQLIVCSYTSIKQFLKNTLEEHCFLQSLSGPLVACCLAESPL